MGDLLQWEHPLKLGRILSGISQDPKLIGWRVAELWPLSYDHILTGHRSLNVRDRRPDSQVISNSVHCCYKLHWTDNNPVANHNSRLQSLCFSIKMYDSDNATVSNDSNHWNIDSFNRKLKERSKKALKNTLRIRIPVISFATAQN